jgi:hypothetical protein
VIDIDGVREGQIVCYGCPYIVDLTIDGRPAHYRSRHGAARLCFEDGEQETVYDSYNEGGGEGFSDIYERHMATMVPALRRKANVRRVEDDERGQVVFQFLEFMRYGDLSFCQVDKSVYPPTHSELTESTARSMVAAFLANTD